MICNWIRWNRDKLIFLRGKGSSPKLGAGNVAVNNRSDSAHFCMIQSEPNYIRNRTEIARRLTLDTRGRIEKIGVNHIIVWCQQLPAALRRPPLPPALTHSCEPPRRRPLYLSGRKGSLRNALNYGVPSTLVCTLATPGNLRDIKHFVRSTQWGGLPAYVDTMIKYADTKSRFFKECILSRGAAHILIEFPCSVFFSYLNSIRK